MRSLNPRMVGGRGSGPRQQTRAVSTSWHALKREKVTPVPLAQRSSTLRRCWGAIWLERSLQPALSARHMF